MHLGFTVTVVLFVSSCTLCSCLEEAHLVPKVGIASKHVLRKRDLSEADTELILKTLMVKLEKAAATSGETGKDIMALLMKMKETGGNKMIEEEEGIQGEKILSEEVPLAEDAAKMELAAETASEADYVDKFSDTDVSLAESLYHMKVAGDVETYPNIKMESLYQKKLGEDKLLEEAKKKTSDEAFVKKVDEMDKALIEEESYPIIKDDDIEGYLKKVAEEEKSLYYGTKVAYSEKTDDEKALEEWKASHKEIFPAEELMLNEKFKMDGVPQVDESTAHELNGELIKKLKTSLGIDKTVGPGYDELLVKDLHKEAGIAEGSPAYEKAKEQAHKDAHIHLTDEGMKEEAVKSKEAYGTEMVMEKGLFEKKAYGFDTKVGTGMEKSLYDKAAEETLKSKDAHSLDKAYGFDATVGIGVEKSTHNIAAEETLKSKDAHALDKSYVFEMDKAIQGTTTAVFDSKVGNGIEKSLLGIAEEEALKSKEAHTLDEANAFEMDKAKKGVTAKGLVTEVGIGIDKTLHGIAGEESVKSKETRGLAFDFEMDKKLHSTETAFNEEVKHAVGHDIQSTFATESDKAFKFPEDELLKKDKAYGIDILFHKDKEVMDTGVEHGVLKGEKAHKFHEPALDKHLVVAKEGIIGAEKSHISFHDLKTKFFELLRRVLHIRKCHLVTMSPGELLSIVSCVSKSKDPILCEKFATCEEKMPIRVIKALEKCQKEIIPPEVKMCSLYAPLYPASDISLKIFQCVAINIGELPSEEKKEMIDFEECARVIKAESCGRFKWLRGLF